ncbi:alcohol oxidase [Mollisia scopiformis]|uniref:Alcohol oxidase n=1 Tax=Mollisia scopiformis TaxID=149040 RepID=A0A194X1M0_MOLSC|nr:alcohol oxidase [Mollisia scopiformis]KUJ13879.1 alcohol oxidase [Mollisia scopiformis]
MRPRIFLLWVSSSLIFTTTFARSFSSAFLFLIELCVILATPAQQPPDVNFEAAQNQTYDYIIVGGGTSGLVVANRLSEDPSISVLVIENGYIDNRPATSIPYLATILNTGDMYDIFSAPVPNLGNQSFRVAVGNVVGGGTIVNGMLWDRGSDADYDAWEKLGNKGWGWADLAPYFKKTNNFTAPSEQTKEYFNITYDESAYGNGPVQVTISSFQDPDLKIFFASYREDGLPMPQEGYISPLGAYWGPNDTNNVTATRCHARASYYDPIQSRPNLKLLTGTRANQILFDDGAELIANGVQMISRVDNSVGKVYATKEVILAAGGVFTSHLLMLSGIGPKDVLEAANITVKKDLPAVGSNYQDHSPMTMNFNLSNLAFPNGYSLSQNATFNASAAIQYEQTRTGPWASGRGIAVAFLPFKLFSANYQNITSKISLQNPLDFLPARYTKEKTLLAGFQKQREILTEQFLGDTSAAGEVPIQAWGVQNTVLEKPLSRGTITLNNTDPEAFPIVQYNTLMNPIDKEILCELVRWNRKHWAGAALAHYSPVETAPGPQYVTDDEIIQGALSLGILSSTFAHSSGACALMPEELGGCVDTELQVYGVKGLSVDDASIIPMIPATHLQATVYAIAERASDIIKSRWSGHDVVK